MGWREYLRHLDYILLVASLGLIAYGVTMVYYATKPDVAGEPLYFVRQQVIAVVLGLIAAAVIAALDYEIYRRFKWWFYGAAVVMLVAVIPLGQEVNGARRWIDLGITRFQPSAAALLLLTLALGAFLADHVEDVGAKRVTIATLALAAVPAFLVYEEPDFGSAVVLMMITLAMLYFAGMPWTHFAVLAGGAALTFALALKALPLVGIHLIEEYQINRLLVFVDSSRDPTGAAYNIIQSKIAIGAGALFGRGNGATQTTLDFLPEHQTDFIFAVISERNGFLGAALLLLLYAVLVWRALRIAVLSRDMYGSILAGGIGVVVLFQMFVNIGMTIGIMPVTGIPLPFVSYGGTHMIAFLMLVGLLQAIHLRATITPSRRGTSWPAA